MGKRLFCPRGRWLGTALALAAIVVVGLACWRLPNCVMCPAVVPHGRIGSPKKRTKIGAVAVPKRVLVLDNTHEYEKLITRANSRGVLFGNTSRKSDSGKWTCLGWGDVLKIHASVSDRFNGNRLKLVNLPVYESQKQVGLRRWRPLTRSRNGTSQPVCRLFLAGVFPTSLIAILIDGARLARAPINTGLPSSIT
jgi:hypothetical protein